MPWGGGARRLEEVRRGGIGDRVSAQLRLGLIQADLDRRAELPLAACAPPLPGPERPGPRRAGERQLAEAGCSIMGPTRRRYRP
jgi:hypothetical protein